MRMGSVRRLRRGVPARRVRSGYRHYPYRTPSRAEWKQMPTHEGKIIELLAEGCERS